MGYFGPGSDPYDDGGYAYTRIEKENEDLKKLLTEICREVEKDNLDLMPKAVRKWWDEYRPWLEKREAEEVEVKRKAKVRKDALSKLSDEEKKELGL